MKHIFFIFSFSLLFLSSQFLLGQDSFGFTGELHDLEKDGLYYNRARYYDPEIGSFVSKDPIGIKDGLNRYQYVASNPVNSTDPTGEFGLLGAVIGGGLDLGIQLYQNGGSFSEVNWTQVGINAAAGAVTGGAGRLISQSSLTLGKKILANTAVGTATGTVAKATDNITKGKDIEDGLMQAAALNAGFSFFGAGFSEVSKFRALTNTELSETLLAKAIHESGEHFFERGSLQALTNNTDKLFTLSAVGGMVISNSAIAADAAISRSQFQGANGEQIMMASAFIPPDTRIQAMEVVAPDGRVTQAMIAQSGSESYGYYSEHNPGGVLIDKAAELINANLSDITGAVFDPVSNQIVFLGNDTASTDKINLDYFYTAIQAVYGSTSPPLVSLDPPAKKHTEWVDYSDGDGIFENGEQGGFFIAYSPVWDSDQTGIPDANVDIVFKGHGLSSGTPYEFTLHLVEDRHPFAASPTGLRWMRLQHDSWTNQPAGIDYDQSKLTAASGLPLTFPSGTSNRQNSYVSLELQILPTPPN